MHKQLLQVLACPLCKGKLVYSKSQEELICRFDKLAYPIVKKIPVMLVDKARALTEEEV